ncbi:FecR family protein [Mucilaginibacter sp.]|uniref:FecR family protein n=1 Tax=Mucilaginibacter sp. TaxID=1882438 RepID=UPI003D130E99
MKEDQAQQLFRKLKAGNATPEETKLLEDWLLQYRSTEAGEFTDADLQSAEARIWNKIQEQPVNIKPIRLWPRIAAAASIILALSAGTYFILHKNPAGQQMTSNQIKNDILPGSNKAILTLSNGQRISLTDAKNGTIAKQAGKNIQKTANGLIVYDNTHSNHTAEETSYNTIETPRGGEYQVVLPDGTKVWLNAASSLKYPVSFEGTTERKVTLTGEGYFEVAKDKAHPFIVSSAKQDVKVLGTHFDINSYSDEPGTKTTLLEGSIQLNNSTILMPGEQADLKPDGNIAVNEVNTSKFIAWKNGKFVFDDENIQSVMRKLSRWYNVDVVYDGNVSDSTFTGSISRFDNISKILDKITYTQAIHFKIEGRRITVIR